MDDKFNVFYPSSWNYWSYPELTYSAANNFPAQLLTVVQKLNLSDVKVFDTSHYKGGGDVHKLGKLFDDFGSDKNGHEYTSVYVWILNKLNKENISLLEIGLGTNDPDFISSMTANGKPGASLRAFREFIGSGDIYGADLDKKILFSEKGIKTAFVDQTKPETFSEMTNYLGASKFDIIIDDGLHSTEANLNTLIFAIDALRIGGYCVIEDIPQRTVDAWKAVSSILGENAGIIIKAKYSYMYVWHKIH